MAGDTITTVRTYGHGLMAHGWYRGWVVALLAGLGTFFGFVYKGLIALEEDEESSRLDAWEKIPRLASALVFGWVAYVVVLHLLVGLVFKRPSRDGEFGAPLVDGGSSASASRV